jgi:excisionase family DNA binding protein
MPDPEPFVDVKIVAQFLGVKVSWVYDQVRLGRIPSYKFGALRRFRLSELERWVGEQRQGSDPKKD